MSARYGTFSPGVGRLRQFTIATKMRYVSITTSVFLWSFVVVCSANPLQTVNWVLEHKGAQFDFDKQRIEWVDDKDGNHRDVSVVAQALVRQGEILATIPWSAIITPTTKKSKAKKTLTTDHPHGRFPCGLARKMTQEIKKGEQSKWAPYVQHLRYWNKKLPSQYSEQAQIVWKQILGGEQSTMILPVVQHVAEDWNSLCGAKRQQKHKILQEAAIWVRQHAFQDLMIPLKDLYPHRNGKYHNVQVSVDPGVGAQIVAKRDIQPGEQLHISYTDCETCGRDQEEDDDYEYGTPEIFRDHGIIERMPQLWTVMEPPNRILHIDEDGEESVMLLEGLTATFRLQEGPLGSAVQVEFLKGDVLNPVFYPLVDAFMRERIQELHRLKNIKYWLPADAYGIADDEWKTIWEFYQAYSTALKLAAYSLHNIMNNQTLPLGDDGENNGEQQEFCRAMDQWDDHYTDFRNEPDQVAYIGSDCQSSEIVDFIHYKVLEVERTNYQEMRWQYRSDNDDICLHLDDVLQICSSYRPHYHEFFVHFPARYVPSIQRVLFLGAGDAMLLHEILKYPNLEKVVGLELDQTITRKSFQYFKTQPHYDDPRVEWWYGDATKTLPLLPRDYWGSFDLVLVDLSETVVSLPVARQHNVLDVIAMLLKPEGVLLENELYLERMIQHFDHTAQIFYGSPKVCIQIHTMSSHSVDFLLSPIYDHQVDTFLIDPVNKTLDRFKFIHDYAKRDPIAQGKCDDNPWNATTATVHGRKAGVFMVLEAENCSRALLEDRDRLEALLYRILTEQGLSPLSSLQRQTSFSTIQIILKEGYVVARVWDKFHYIGFDFSWWGAFSKMESVRDAVADALEATTRSSFRVVVGGMYGSSTWEQDQNEIGVQFSPKRQKCSPPDQAWQPELLPSETMQVVMDESLQLLKDPSDLVVLVACGDENKQDECSTLQILKANAHVVKVVPFFACEDLPYFNNGSFAFGPMYKCERDMLDRLSKFHDSENLRHDALVVDLSAPLSMLQIFSSVWTIAEHRNQWLAPDYIVAVPWVPNEPQRQKILENFRRISHGTVATLADFRLDGAGDDNSSGIEDKSFLGWGVLTVNDENAISSLSRMENRLKDRLTKTDVEVRRMEGGQLHRPEDLLLERRSFGPKDYNYGPHAKQMAEQRPLGRQSIFQLEATRNDTCVSIPETLVMALEKTLETLEYHDGPAMLPSEIQTWVEVGEGLVVTSIFATGNIVLVWDGVDHVDVNLFDEDQSRDQADKFLDVFLLQTEWKLLLRDDQPRGFGRVVNFSQ